MLQATRLALSALRAEGGLRREALSGFKRRAPQVSQWLKSLGLKRRQVGMIPAKAERVKPATFKQDPLEPRLEAAQPGKKGYFVDAADFGLAGFLGDLGSFCRLFIQAAAGGQRFNRLAALAAKTHQLLTLTKHP